MEALYRKVEEMIISFESKNPVVLDVGCGTGYNTVKLKKITSKIIGLDINDLVKKKYRNDFRLVLGDGRKLPFKDNSFDLITCWDVIEHINEDNLFLKEIYRVLNHGGKVFLSTPNRNRLSNLIFRIFRKIEYPYDLGANKDIGDVIHVREYIPQELINLCKKNKFKVNNYEGVFFGLVGIGGLYRVPTMLENISQHIFLTLSK